MKEETKKVLQGIAKKELRCPRCNSLHNYRRIKTNEQVCQSCGHVWEPDKQK